MPATHYICPNEDSIEIAKCLEGCPNPTRCMFLPTLKAIGNSLHRNLDKASVTELLIGTRESFLKATTSYAVDPQKQVYALHGNAVHTLNEKQTDGNMLCEQRFFNDVTSGKLDLYGQILSEDIHTLGDIKITNSYKLAKALGIYKQDVQTGEVYKSGARQGQQKTRKELHFDGVRHNLDWAVQINYYRLLLEQNGFKVNTMLIQALCRDVNTRIASERGIDKPIYLIPINKISDIWLMKFMAAKASLLDDALKTNTLPPPCRKKERWNDRKCLEYCQVACNCDYAQSLKSQKVIAA